MIVGDWALDPAVLATLAALALVYARGLRARRRGQATWRVAAFYAGLAFAFVALITPVATLAEALFLAHMVQHLLLVMVSVPLVLLGAPARPLLLGLPRAVRAGVIRPLARDRAVHALGRVASRPLVALGAYIGVLTLWHLPAMYDTALLHVLVHAFEHASFVLVAVLFWSQVIDPLPWRAPLPYPLRIALLFVATAHNTILGGILSFAEQPLYQHYAALAERPFGIPALVDQQWAGILMWVPGGMMHLLAISVVFGLWLRAEDRPVLESPRSSHQFLR